MANLATIIVVHRHTDGTTTNREYFPDIASREVVTAILTAQLIKWPKCGIEESREEYSANGWKAFRDVFTITVIENGE